VAAGPAPVEKTLVHATLADVQHALRAPDAPPAATLPQRTAVSTIFMPPPAASSTPTPPPAASTSATPLRLLRRVGRADPERLDDYRAHGGYRALRRAFELGPAGVLREVTESRLLGRGGAAFPT